MAELKLTAVKKDSRTVLSSLYFTTPNKIAKPFYDGEKTKVIVMQASAGLLDGDKNSIDLNVEKDAHLIYTGQSFTKVFSCPSGEGVVQKLNVSLQDNATLFYSAMPVVPFTDSVYQAENKIFLTLKSRLFYSDVFCCGRKERGEKFGFNRFISRTSVYVDGKIVFFDNTRFVPEEYSVDSIGFFEGFSHTGFIYMYGLDCPDYSSLVTEKIHCASSQCLKGTVIRLFAHDAESIISFVSGLSGLF